MALVKAAGGKTSRAWVWTGLGGTMHWRETPALVGKTPLEGIQLTLEEFAKQFPEVPVPVFSEGGEIVPLKNAGRETKAILPRGTATPMFALSTTMVIEQEPADEPSPHFIHTILRERIVEHLFVGECLRRLWQRGVTDVEVLRSEFDAGGYDLVMSRGKVVRHIQLKTLTDGGKAGGVSIGLKLGNTPCGCVIWIVISKDLDLLSYLWFGGAPGERLPSLDAMRTTKHTRANAQGIKAEKPAHRIVPKGQFKSLATIDDVLHALFGPLP